MKSFQVREGKVMVDGVVYSQNPTDVNIMGKMGKILSINIPNRGQFFPITGHFDDGTIVDVDSTIDETTPTKRTKATKMVESNGIPTDENGNPIKKKRSKKK